MTAKPITTYREMNEKIVELLELSEIPIELYAAQRIRELEEQVEELKQQQEQRD